MSEPWREFDFWIGDWDVRTPDGALAGRNRITAILDGRALREEWRGASGLVGTSLNVWSTERKAWHQTWIDSTGGLLLLDGGLRDGVMVLEGATRDPATDVETRHRISWSLLDDDPDALRQLWETSGDGSTWETAFDGRYTRAQSPGD